MPQLSQWDLEHFTPEEQEKALQIKSQWGVDPNQNASLHSSLEAMRGKYNYSGGVDGSQFMPNDMYGSPKAPVLKPYESPYANELDEIMKQLRNPPKYNSQYEDLIAEQISNIQNRPKFEYNSDEDEAFQAFKARATRAGDKAFADNLGGLSAMTGGRANSWAGTVASQARNTMMLEAEEAVIHFEDRAYSRYRDETQDMYNFVNLLQTQDQTMYNRFRDTIGDTKDLANMVLRLEDNAYRQYKDLAENQWNIFEAEYSQFKDVLQSKKDRVTEAINRTDMTGFVNNKDAITLGVPVGTLSQSARERAENMQDYIRKSEIDLENFKKEKEISHNYDVKMFNLRESASSSSGRRSGGSPSGGSPSGGVKPVELSMADFKRKDDEVKSVKNFLDSDEYKILNSDGKYKYFYNWEKNLINDAMNGRFGKFEEDGSIVAGMILEEVGKTNEYKNQVLLYEEWNEYRKGANTGDYRELLNKKTMQDYIRKRVRAEKGAK